MVHEKPSSQLVEDLRSPLEALIPVTVGSPLYWGVSGTGPGVSGTGVKVSGMTVDFWSFWDSYGVSGTAIGLSGRR